MTDVHILAIDLAKRSFQVCATAAAGAVHFDTYSHFGRITSHQPASDHLDDLQYNSPVANPRYPVRQTKIRLDPAHLRLTQQS